MKLLIVLQNAYGVEDGYVPSYERESFRKCYTGIRLKEVIPDNAEIKIVNSNPSIGIKSDSYFKPDVDYVKTEIGIFAPEVILFCGRNGKILMKEISFNKSIHMPHPAYRALSKKMTAEVKDRIVQASPIKS